MRSNARHSFWWRGVLTFCVGVAISASAAAVRPNVVLIITDDQRWDTLSCAGSPFLKPNIDRLANEGARFKNAFCTTSLCSPSQARDGMTARD